MIDRFLTSPCENPQNLTLPLACERALPVTPPTKPGEPPSRLRQWSRDELKEYQARTH
jgi:hypothetical protein